MARELSTIGRSGLVLDAEILNNGQLWNNVTHVFETPVVANWVQYAIPLVEESTSGYYVADMPTQITTAGVYAYVVRLRAGGSPAVSDPVYGSGTVTWSGSQVILNPPTEPFVVVETGLIVAGANSYIDVAYSDMYHTDRGHLAWMNLTTPNKSSALVRACSYVDKRFSLKFKGQRVRWDQPMQFPRINVWDEKKRILVQSNQIPNLLKMACAEYALRAALIGELSPDPVPFVPIQDLNVATPVRQVDQAFGQIRRIAEKVDKIEETKSYNTPDMAARASYNRTPDNSLVTMANIPEYPEADMWLKELLRSSNSRRIVRM